MGEQSIDIEIQHTIKLHPWANQEGAIWHCVDIAGDFVCVRVMHPDGWGYDFLYKNEESYPTQHYRKIYGDWWTFDAVLDSSKA
jgi:hypothetical protein